MYCLVNYQILLLINIGKKDPIDKAGGYAIQGFESQFIEKIHGSYHAIIGLPIYEVSQALRYTFSIFPK